MQFVLNDTVYTHTHILTHVGCGELLAYTHTHKHIGFVKLLCLLVYVNLFIIILFKLKLLINLTTIC